MEGVHMFKQYEMELAGRTLRVDIGRVCAQANGAALMHYGDTVVLSTATASKEPREGIDFFPLSVEYEEKMYAAGKIPGGFNKREGKASENAILTSRVIDRPMRPLFPKDYRNDVTLNNMVMSVDENCRPELLAMIGSAIATSISDIPFDGPCATTQIGMIDGEFIVNPSQAQWQDGDLQLTVASTKQKVIMIEAGANEIPEDKMIEAIYKAHDINQTIIAFIDKIVAEVGKEKHSYVSCAVPAEMFEAMKQVVSPEEMEVAVFTDDKQTREKNIDAVTEKMKEAFVSLYISGKGNSCSIEVYCACTPFITKDPFSMLGISTVRLPSPSSWKASDVSLLNVTLWRIPCTIKCNGEGVFSKLDRTIFTSSSIFLSL